MIKEKKKETKANAFVCFSLLYNWHSNSSFDDKHMAGQNKKKKTIGREEGVGGQEGISPSTPRTT